MNARLSLLYVAMKNNFVIAYETNLLSFVKEVNQQIPKSDRFNYNYFVRQFKNSDYISLSIDSQEYHFQKVFDKNRQHNPTT